LDSGGETISARLELHSLYSASTSSLLSRLSHISTGAALR
jgi:hypothetical protein